MRYIKSDDPLINDIATIHEYIPSDYSDYQPKALDIALRKESIQLLMEHKGDIILVKAQGDTLIAFIWFHIGQETHIKSLWVDAEYRKENIATTLKQMVHQLSKDKGVNKVVSTVHKNNERMQHLNLKLGYIKQGDKMILHLNGVPND